MELSRIFIVRINRGRGWIPVLGNPVRVHLNPAGNSDTAEAYHWLIKSSGKWLLDEGNQMTPEDFAKAYALYAFDLEPSFQDRGYLTLVKQGIVRITANFSKP